jgi:hypothetical protein
MWRLSDTELPGLYSRKRKDHLEDQMTVIDPTNFTAPWHVNRTYQRVAHVRRM